MNRRAFTLIEVIVILAVIGILAGVAVPLALKVFERTAEQGTREEMDNIKRAILGDARKLQGPFRSDFGYLGDIGCLPTDLRRILLNPPPALAALPTWTFDATRQTGAGWKGPYITGAATGQEVEEYTKDGWGSNYTYTPAVGACPLTATLTSPAADLASAADDITVSILAGETTATVRGTVRNAGGVGLPAVPVEFYSAANSGILTTTSILTDVNGNFTFLLAPFGSRAIRAMPVLLLLVPGSVTTQSNGETVNFDVINYSPNPITITSVTASWNPSAGTRYDNILINGVGVDGCSNVNSGVNCDITDTAVAASSTPNSSLRVSVDSADALLPDIRLVGGSAVAITLEFEGGDDMRGRNFTVQLNHTVGPSVVTFTP